MVALASGVAVLLLAGAVLAVVVLGGGDDGGTEPPDLSDLAVGTDPNRGEFCDEVDVLAELRHTASPVVWAESIRLMAQHAYDEDAERFARVSAGWFQWNIEGQRSQALFDEVEEAAAEAPAEECGEEPFFLAGEPGEDAERLQEQSEALAEQQGLAQPENRSFLAYGIATVVLQDPTPDQALAACRSWGDEPYETLADDGVLIIGRSDDDIEVMQDPVVRRTGVDEECELLEPTG